MLTQLIVTSAVAGAWGPEATRQIALAKPPQFHITNTVTLRGFLGKNAEAPPSDGIAEDAYAVLLLATVSGIWDLSPMSGPRAPTGIASSVLVHSSAEWFVG
ncbi:hypothetical protein HNQ77_004729 [Silvibacterium bohemicum]|uniref:Uncharacterized protein n=1 Tax=Silvibacterium bohemicum TaxID=1577686 RepID=A0A841K849_9BACT|nr:hypothetical protein [Silvibacterium bohemicum]MBB6146748.1 hypothetical protein [Silvibacterium bohemicum]